MSRPNPLHEHLYFKSSSQKAALQKESQWLHFDRADVVASQCRHLERFASFEMDNAVVARRYMARIQLQVDRGGKPEEPIDYYKF